MPAPDTRPSDGLSRDIVVLGASAGGVNALKTVLGGLPADLPATLFAVVHTTTHAPNALASVIERTSQLKCRFATDGEPTVPGTVYFPPSDHHLILRDGTVQLGRGPRENGFRPAVDVLFRSAALTHGPRVIGVILTGNMDDGAAGCQAIKECGGVTIAQDPAEAMFPGMPQSVIDHGVADHVARLEAIPALLQSLCSEGLRLPGHAISLDMTDEVDVAAGERSQRRVGGPSDYGCPDCGGPLRRIEDEHGGVRFRCHVGHAWSSESLAEIQRTSIEDAVWTAIRWLEEEQMLAQHGAELARRQGRTHAADLFDRRSRLAAARSLRLRELLRDADPPPELTTLYEQGVGKGPLNRKRGPSVGGRIQSLHRGSPMLSMLCTLIALQAPAAPPVVTFVDVTVLPMDTNRLLEHQTVVVRDGKITQIGPAAQVRVPEGATRVDGRGKFLMPGFAEMHGHLPNAGAANAISGIVETVLFLYVANGVTAVRGMQGNRDHLELRARIARGELLGPRLWVPGPALSGNNTASPAEGKRKVEENKDFGYDHLKIHENLSRETYDTIVATAKRVGLDFAGHVPAAVGVQHALTSGQKSIEHLDNYAEEIGGDDGKRTELVRATVAAGAWTVPTLALWEVFVGSEPVDSLAARPELRYVPPQWVAGWRQQVSNIRQQNPADDGMAEVLERRRILKALRDGGAKIAFGTDSPQLFSVPGFSIHREMQSMLAAGLSPFDILASGTRNVGRYYGREQEFGTVAAGQRADLVLLDADPLTDLRNFSRRAGVMVNGRWLLESEIQARLSQIANQFGAN